MASPSSLNFCNLCKKIKQIQNHFGEWFGVHGWGGDGEGWSGDGLWGGDDGVVTMGPIMGVAIVGW